MEKGDVVQSKEAMREEARSRGFKYESTYHGCSQCTMLALQEVLGLEDELVFKAASCLHGGMPVEGKVCGALNAGVMVLGMKYGRASLEERIAGTLKGMLQVLKLVKRFEQEFGTTACLEITEGQTRVMDEEVLNSYARGSVKGNDTVGGFVGIVRSGGPTIRNCYSNRRFIE